MKTAKLLLFFLLTLTSALAQDIVVADSVSRAGLTPLRMRPFVKNGNLYLMPKIGAPIQVGGAASAPVQSVAGKTGTVNLVPGDVSGLPDSLTAKLNVLKSASEFATARAALVRWDGSDWVRRNGTTPTVGLNGIYRAGPANSYFERLLNGQPVTPKMFGAFAGAKVVYDAATSAGSAVITSATAVFTAALVGQKIMIRGAVAGGTPLVSTIASVQSSSQLTMTNVATASVSGVECTYGGVDETAQFQACVDYLIAVGGGKLFIPPGRYWVEGTIFITPAKQIPIAIEGSTENPMLDGWGTTTAGTTIMRSLAGDIIRVNMNAAGSGVQGPTTQYVGFSIKGISFVGKSDVAGISAIKVFRTRGNYQNLFGSRIDYLINQPAQDASANTSYNDQSVYENIRISSSRYSGALLTYADASVINGFYFEGPQPTAKYALEITNSSTVAASGILHWSDGTHQTISGGSFLRLNQVFGSTFRGVHMEKVVYETGFDLVNCGGLGFNGLFTNFSSNDMFRISTVLGLEIKNWYSWETKGSNTYDINFVTGTINQDILWDNAVFYDRAFSAGTTPRLMLLNNIGSRGKITRSVQREDVTDFNSVQGWKYLRSTTASPSNAPQGTWTNGLQINLNDDNNFARQLVESNGYWWKRNRSSGTWGSWIRIHDEQSLGPASSIVITGGSIKNLSALSVNNVLGIDFLGTGTNTNQFSVFPGSGGGFSNALLKARNANRSIGLILLPNGSSTTSKINWSNSSDSLNYGSLAWQVIGNKATMYSQNVGSAITTVTDVDLGTSITTQRLMASKNSIWVATGAGNPTTSDIGSGYYMLWKNTTSGQNAVWANDAGTMKALTRFSGIATFSATGSQTSFVIAHGLGYVPTDVSVTALSQAAAGPYSVSIDATNLTVIYATAPTSGTNNIVLNWGAR